MYRKRWINESECIIEQLIENDKWRKCSDKSIGYINWIETHDIEEILFVKKNNIYEELDLEDYKIIKKQQLAHSRWEEEIDCIILDKKNNVIINTDRNSTEKLNSIALQLLQNPNYQCKFKTSNGWIDLNPTMIIAVNQMSRKHIQDCFDKEYELDKKIEKASTQEEVEAIEW